jgi:hypothetical protein
VTHLYISHQQSLIQLSPWKSVSVTRAQSLALSALEKGEVSKDLFFRLIWGKQKYVARLHDPLIWNTIHRLKRGLGVRVSIEEGGIFAPELLVL